MGEKTAGRELDAEVAGVMGVKPTLAWQVMSPDEHSSVLGGSQAECKEWLADHQKRFPNSPYAGFHVGAWKRYPRYSTDIGAAWTVVEKMHELGWWMRLQSPFEADDTVWNAGFTAHGCTGWNGRPDHSGQADTAPLAICLAVLAAMPAASGTLASAGDPARRSAARGTIHKGERDQ